VLKGVASGVPTWKCAILQEAIQADGRIVKKLDRGLPDVEEDEGPKQRSHQDPELQIAIGHGWIHQRNPRMIRQIAAKHRASVAQ
jgi:hypothetical protein